MAYAGQMVENPVTGELIVFRQTSADTNGELVAIDLSLPPGGHVPGLPVHPKQEESFDVTSGQMKFRLGLKTIVDEVRAPFPPAWFVRLVMTPLRAMARRRDYRRTSRKSSQTRSTAPAAA